MNSRAVLLCSIFGVAMAFYVVKAAERPRAAPTAAELSESALDARPESTPKTQPEPAGLLSQDDASEPSESSELRELPCGETPDDCVFAIVGDSRTSVRLASIRSNALQILQAIDTRGDKPVGVNLFAAANVAEVVLVSGRAMSGQATEPDLYHVLFENPEGKKTLLLELASLGVDSNGYERLAFESMLAYADAVDRSLFSFDETDASPKYEFPHKVYPPVSFARAQEQAGEKLSNHQPNNPSTALTSPRATTGEPLWENALGYEISIVGETGGADLLWVDAFSGVAFTQAELDQILSDKSKRRALIDNLDARVRTELARTGKLESFALAQVPYRPKEIERIQTRKSQPSL